MTSQNTEFNPTMVNNESNILKLSSELDLVESYTKRMPNFVWYHRAMGNVAHTIKISDTIMGYEHTITFGKNDIGQLL